MIRQQQLEELYTRYGYKKKVNNKDYSVYLLSEGMYHGVEIIKHHNEANVEKIESDYKTAGYAVKVRKYNSIEEAENDLFDGFFNIKQLSKRTERRYSEFCHKQELQLIDDCKYSYINVRYKINNPADYISETNIINDVLKTIEQQGACFIIIEAAAGFGKTCTAYEILKNIPEKLKSKVPLFTELSRDRQAKIFRYVLYSAIENEFQNMINRELVEYQIQAGRIPLIVDGFDELLSESSDKTKDKESFEQVETMLGTLSKMLVNNAKVILTSRKTAIFSSKEFQDWSSRFDNQFSVIRFIIEEPKIKDWLIEEKYQFLKNQRDNLIRHIANPVLLTFLKHINFETFSSLLSTPDEIVNKYFNALLEREQVRQDLSLSTEKQIDIFENLALFFTDLNIYAEQKSFVKEALIDYNTNVLEKLRKSTPGKPSIDDLAEKLTNHATLDRLKTKGENIGFINDFIFGTFIGLGLIKNKLNSKELNNLTQNYAELAVNAFKYQNSDNKNRLHKTLLPILDNYSKSFDLFIQINLTGKIEGNYLSQEFNAFTLDSISLSTNVLFDKCIFNECRFYNCELDSNVFKKTTFLGCTFYNCKVIDANTKADESNDYVYIYGCIDYDNGFINDFEKNNHEIEITQDDLVDYEKVIFSFLFKVDRTSPKIAFVNQIKDETYHMNEQNQKMLFKKLHKLNSAGLVRIDGNTISITKDGLRHYFDNLKS